MDQSMRCSFCHKPQSKVGKLISSPSDFPRAYICDECIATCAAILEDDQPEPEPVPESKPSPDLTTQLLQAAEDWVHAEALGNPNAEQLARLRDVAQRLFRVR